MHDLSRPTFQIGIILTKYALVLFTAEVLTSVFVVLFHELRAEVHHLLHREVAGEGTILVAVDAVFWVLAAIGVGAEDFWGERHSAALTKLLFFFHIDVDFCFGLFHIALRAFCPLDHPALRAPLKGEDGLLKEVVYPNMHQRRNGMRRKPS